MKRKQQDAFLKAFCLTARISDAAQAAGIDRTLHYVWLRESDYAARFAAAKEQAGDLLEDEAVRRAREGVLKPLSYRGEFTFEPLRDEDGAVLLDDAGNERLSDVPFAIREFSDSLLQFLLKGFKPEKYRDKSAVELSGAAGGPISVKVEFVEP